MDDSVFDVRHEIRSVENGMCVQQIAQTIEIGSRMTNLKASPFCLCTVVSDTNLDSVLQGSGEGFFTDSHPWFYAKELFDEAMNSSEFVSILFADHEPLVFTHWALVQSMDVVEFTGSRYGTRIQFGQLNEINPIWESIDSVTLRPSAEQLRREQLEPIRILREHVQELHLRPYAICDTPAFILNPTSMSDETQ